MLKKNKINRRTFRDNFTLFLFTAPVLLGLFIFNYLPMFGVVLAFKDYKYSKGIFGSDWIGIENFRYFFTSQDAWRITRNTVLYNVTFIIVGIAMAVFIALMLYEISNRVAIKYYQTAMILPRFLSWVIVSYIVYIFLNPVSGLFNQILKALGMERVQWYADTRPWPAILIVANVWKHVGLDCIIYYSALLGVDREQYEAATIDGASHIQQVFHISIPSILPVIIIMFILAVGGIFGGDFGLFYQLPRNIGTLYPVTDIIPTYVFRGMQGGDYAVSAATGLFQSVVGLCLVLGTNAIVRKISPEQAMF